MRSNKASLVVDVGGSHINISIVENEKIIESVIRKSDHSKSFLDCLDLIEDSCNELMSICGLTHDDFSGIGIAVPMLVDSSKNAILATAKGKYEDATEIDLMTWAQDTFNLKLHLEVDSRAACVGEWIHGAGTGLKDMVYVIIGTGYGSSVVMGGKLLRGRQGLSGVRGGHISVNAGDHRRQCVCPGSGCAESEIGSWSIDQSAKNDSRYDQSRLSKYAKLDYKIIFNEADRNDDLAKSLVDERIRYLSVSVLNLVHAYNPEKIILAGGLMKDAEKIIPRVNDYLRTNIWAVGFIPEVVVAEHPETAALLGMNTIMNGNIDFL